MSTMSHALLASSASGEWTTPPDIIARVQTVLGHIDLDPAADAGHTVPAATHYTKDDDGLRLRWGYCRGEGEVPASIYLNPPYGRLLPRFIGKFAAERSLGHIRQAILLLPARTDTAWFQPLWGMDAICFVRGRLKFGNASNGAPFPSLLAYCGPEPWIFETYMAPIGKVVRL